MNKRRINYLVALMMFTALGAIAAIKLSSKEKKKEVLLTSELVRNENRDNKSHKRPNILFAISDDQSWLHTSINGCKAVKTPIFDRLAAEGILFTNAFGVAPQCSPNRATILTGRNIWQLEEAGTHGSNFPKKYVTFPDILEKSGYQIAYTGKGWGPGNWKVNGRTRNPAGPAIQKHKIKNRTNTAISNNDYSANFEEFINNREKGKPFFFWYGAHEPHRVYLKGSGVAAGKKLNAVKVPRFLPDSPEIRSDILDYLLEIEWFDSELGKMLKLLKEKGELENTIVVVTSDNGMPFPKAKANLYEYGIHMPLAVYWPEKIKSGRVVTDLISFSDFAPTFLEIAGAKPVSKITGKSFLNILESDKQGAVDSSREYILAGRERHTHARPNNFGYPSRAIRTQEYLYIWNLKPERWPAGNPTGSGDPEGYHDIDGSPSKTFMIENQKKEKLIFHQAFDKRPEEELYNIKIDPGCMNNLAGKAEFDSIKRELKTKLKQKLTQQQDPRMLGNGDIFESYPRYSRMRKFKGFKDRGAYNPKFQVNTTKGN